MRILIVDDSEDSRILLEAIVRQAGMGEVVHATTALEAFRVLGIVGPVVAVPDIDLILLDVDMPGTDGILACRRIHKMRQLRHIPIVMVTAHHEEAVLEAAFREGAVDYLTKPVRRRELVARVNAALDRKRQRDREALERRDLEFKAGHDTLTGVSRRRAFMLGFRTEWRRAQRHGKPLSFVMLDVDHFHDYNEAYGHPAGDECLRRIANQLDAGPWRAGDLLSRFGGEEFALLLPETGLEGAVKVAEDVRARIERLAIPHVGSRCASVVTASLGVATLIPSSEVKPTALIGAADEALFAAKAAGRNRVEIAGPDAQGVPRAVSSDGDAHLRGGASR